LETMVKKLYEGMFLVDSADAASDWEGVLDTIRTILDRADAELVSMRKWDERKLAYDIDGKSRGTYILCYFRAEGSRIAGIERDVQLNDRVMLVLILNAEHMTQENIDKATPAEMAERGEVKRAEEKDAEKAEDVDEDIDEEQEGEGEEEQEEGEEEEGRQSKEEEDEEEEGEEKESGGDDEAEEESEEEQQEGEAKKDEDVGEEKEPEGSEEDEQKN